MKKNYTLPEVEMNGIANADILTESLIIDTQNREVIVKDPFAQLSAAEAIGMEH